jgi:uncharacterized protein YaaR (DUF327 family)
MEKDYKIYQKALVIIEGMNKPNAKCNALLKIRVESDDAEFSTLLDESIRMYKLYIKPTYYRNAKNGDPSNNREWHTCIKEKNTKLKNYIEDILKSKKPLWQVLAEKNGWAKL